MMELDVRGACERTARSVQNSGILDMPGDDIGNLFDHSFLNCPDALLQAQTC